ncbi:MAG: GNAT family N-acetyltransferase [Pseudomonadota bacterium]
MHLDRLEIRFAKATDVSTLAGLMLESNRHYWGDWDGASAMTSASAQAMIAGRSGCKAIIAWKDDLPIAFATVSVLHPAPSEHGTLFMKDLFVTESARGTGVGTHVMRHLAGLATKLGCKRFDWTAETDNPRALEFYDRLGATRVEEKIYFRFSGNPLASLAAESGRDGDA